MFKIRVPATTANMGPGFDCIGMAFRMYNELSVEEADILEIIPGNADIPATEANLIYKTIAGFYSEIGKPVPGVRLIQNDSIPIARGLGSSAACIIAGLMAANRLCGELLSKDELAQMACRIEGHPDNVTPAVYGGIVVGAISEQTTKLCKLIPPPELAFIAFKPDFTLLTEHSRGVLPDRYTRVDAVFNISRAALFIASLMTGEWDNLRVAVGDRLHQPYRSSLIPDMDSLFKTAYDYGAKAVFLSGAGPIIIAIVKTEDESGFVANMADRIEAYIADWEIVRLLPDIDGAIIM